MLILLLEIPTNKKKFASKTCKLSLSAQGLIHKTVCVALLHFTVLLLSAVDMKRGKVSMSVALLVRRK